MNYSIRKAAAADWSFIERLYLHGHVRAAMHGPSREQFTMSLGRDDCFSFILERDAQPFGHLKIDLPETWLAVLSALAVTEARKGAGRFALGYAIDFAFNELHVHRVFGEIVETNIASRKLCEAAGLRAEGVYRDGYRDESGQYRNLIPYGILATDV